jgi:chromosome segregation ATPase
VEPGEEDADIKEVKQQLKKSQHVIAQFYQENRELRRKLTEIIPEAQASQSKAGQRSPTSPTGGENNIKWLKKKLREAQDEIIKLREEKRISEEGIMKHYKKCRPTIDDACATLSDAQSKLKRNAALLRQVRSLKRQNLSLRKENRALRLQVRLDKEATDKLNDPILCCQLDSCEQPQHEDPSREIVAQISQPTFAQQKPEFTAQR